MNAQCYPGEVLIPSTVKHPLTVRPPFALLPQLPRDHVNISPSKTITEFHHSDFGPTITPPDVPMTPDDGLPVSIVPIRRKVPNTVSLRSITNYDLSDVDCKPCHIQKRLSHIDLVSMSPDEFEELELIGKGTFGVVIKVRRKSDNVIHVMKSQVDEDSRDSVFRELLVHRNLRHPNILRYVGCTSGKERKLSIISEFIEGGSLSVIIIGTLHLPWSLRCSYARDIAAGMHYLHENHIAHRDLNPTNCLVRKSNQVVISDFGMAIHLPSDVNSWQREVCGNPFHMAPEMLANRPYTESVDVYSFGVILCELMTRIAANPDSLPVHDRTMAMDMDKLKGLINEDCPTELFLLAQECCQCNPLTRVTAIRCYTRLNLLLFRLEKYGIQSKVTLNPAECVNEWNERVG